MSFTLDEAQSYKSIEIGLQGGAHVAWNETGQQENGRTNNRIPYHSRESFVEHAMVVWMSEQSPDGTLGAGAYSYEFQFSLPSNSLGSFEGCYGSISYVIYGLLRKGKPLHPDHKIEVCFPVLRSTDVNVTQFKAPVRQSRRKKVGFSCCSNDIELTASLSRTGFCIGQNVPVNINIVNGSFRRVKIRASVKKQCKYYAQGHSMCETTRLASVLCPDIITNSQYSWSPDDLVIPDVEPSFEGSTIIQLQYVVEVTAVIPWAKNSTVIIPIAIGNVPFDK